MESEFVFDVAPTAAVHASSIVETPRGLIAAWFGGSCEGHDDVAIWIAERPARARRWSEPRRVATGEQLDGGRYPCWNPVLHRLAGGTLLLLPGFLTDVVGFLLVLPVTRPLFRGLLAAAVAKRLLGDPVPGPRGPSDGPTVIEGEIVD